MKDVKFIKVKEGKLWEFVILNALEKNTIN